MQLNILKSKNPRSQLLGFFFFCGGEICSNFLNAFSGVNGWSDNGFSFVVFFSPFSAGMRLAF